MTNSKWYIFTAVIAALLAGRAQEAAPDRSGSTGILLQVEGSSLRIRHMIIGSPARNSGDLDVGDELVAVAEAGGERQPLDHTPVERALELLAGPPGSEVVVFVHSGIGESRAVKLTRAKLARGADNADLLLLEEGTVAPDFEFTDLGSGRTNRFSAVRGEPVMLVFWATWDPHCRAAMATLQRSLPEYDPAARQRILTVSIDHTMEAAADYVAGREWQGVRHAWTGGEAPERYRIRKLPEAFLIDAAGVIRRVGDPVALDAKPFLTPPRPAP